MKRVAFGEPSKTKPPPRGAFFLTKPHFIPPSRTTPIPPLFQRAIRACPPHMPTLCFHHVSMANAAKPYVSLRYPSANPLETCHFSLTPRSELTPETPAGSRRQPCALPSLNTRKRNKFRAKPPLFPFFKPPARSQPIKTPKNRQRGLLCLTSLFHNSKDFQWHWRGFGPFGSDLSVFNHNKIRWGVGDEVVEGQ